MTRVALMLLGAIALTAGQAGASARQRALIVTSQDHSLVDAEDCDGFHTRNTTSLPAAAASEEERKVPLSGTFRVRVPNAGGVAVKGWDRPFARLTVCKSVAALSETQARSALRKVNVRISNGQIDANGPELSQTQTWWVHMILRVPKSANVEVAAANGGIAIRNIDGRVTASATNGGISLAHCTGENHVSTENGGISLDKISGPLNARTQNGPISLKLRDADVPPLEAQTDEAGEIMCNLKGCADGLGNWTSDRKHLRIGEQPPIIRLTSLSADIMIDHVR